MNEPRQAGLSGSKRDARLDLSIVICCYNSTARLPDTMRHLLSQKGAEQFGWEVVLIDNGSTDGTAEVARGLWLKESSVPFRIVPEPKQGLSFARRRGITEARGHVICFVDDDNWLCETYVRRVIQIFRDDPSVAACGGLGIAAFEGLEPPWFGELQGYFAVGPQGAGPGYVVDSRDYLVGAGIALRRLALEQLDSIGFAYLLTGRSGKALTSGDDLELCYALQILGWRLYYDPSLVYWHFMPRQRMTESYLKRLVFSIGAAEPILDIYRAALPSGNSSLLLKSPSLHWRKKLYWEFRLLLRMLYTRPQKEISMYQRVASLRLQMSKVRHCVTNRRKFFEAHRKIAKIRTLTTG